MTYFLSFVGSVFLGILSTLLSIRIAKRMNFFDSPNPRKIHQSPVPYLGGAALFLAIFLSLLILEVFWPKFLSFDSSYRGLFDKKLLGVFFASFLLVIVGTIDDWKKLSPFIKLFFQIIAGVIAVIFGIGIIHFLNPFGPSFIELDSLKGTSLGSTILVYSGLFSILWVVIMTNTVNVLDGLDGLATGITIIGALFIAFLSLGRQVNQPSTALLAFIVAGACLGFLFFNFYPAKIFLGDGGSLMLGFVLATLAIISGSKIATASLVLGIPILDFVWSSVRRIISKKAPWFPDKEHLHHRLLSVGFSQRKAVFIFYGLSLVFGIVGLLSSRTQKIVALLAVMATMIILSIFI